VKYFVPVTLIAEIYQPWNVGKCDTSLPLPKTLSVRQTSKHLHVSLPACVERHDHLNFPRAYVQENFAVIHELESTK
jgi:hypothetical protein